MNDSTGEKIQNIKKWLGSGSINIFGMPFSGKDTQCERLAKWLNAPVIGGGDIIRKSQNIPDSVRQIVDQGILAPTEDYLKIVTPYLSQTDFHGKPLVLSSVGRWHGEEPAIVQGATDSGHPLKAVILLNLSEDTVRERWRAAQQIADRGQRADDAAHVLDKRLAEFSNKTLPVIDYYRQAGLLIEVDGSKSRDEVTAEIIDKLYGLTS